MKNADMPAMPVYETNGDGVLELSSVGLTKREHFAGLAMQALISSRQADENYRRLSIMSANYADALLEELAK